MHRRALLQALAAGSITALTGCNRKVAVNAASQLTSLDAIAQAELVISGQLSAVDLVSAAIQRIEATNATLNAVIFQDFERALTQARTAAGPLAGVPYLIKDLNAYRDMPLTRGSKLFAKNTATEQTAFTDSIDATGVVVVGKTNTPEFGLLPSTEPLLHGATRNPWQIEHTPGGSSGGAAAAVAARMLPAAQASDGGGSIRIPAAMCGIFGLKPTAGRFPDQGHGDQPWPISIKHAVTLSVRDSALLLALTERQDSNDLLPVVYVQPERVKPMRIAMSLNSLYGAPDDDVAAGVQTTAQRLEAIGHEIIEVEQTPLLDEAFSDDFLVLWSAGTYQVAEQVRAQTGMPPEETGLLEPATLALARAFAQRPQGALPKALEGLARYQRTTIEFLEQYDAWLTPVTASVAPKIGAFSPTRDFDELMPAVSRFAAYTPTHNAAGTPAMSVPVGRNDAGLPLAAQLASSPGNEALLLQLAYQLEATHGWIDDLPPVHA